MTRLPYNALQPSAARVTMDHAEGTAVLAGGNGPILSEAVS